MTWPVSLELLLLGFSRQSSSKVGAGYAPYGGGAVVLRIVRWEGVCACAHVNSMLGGLVLPNWALCVCTWLCCMLCWSPDAGGRGLWHVPRVAVFMSHGLCNCDV